MNALTQSLLTVADTIFPGGRAAFLDDLVPLVADKKFFSTEEVAERYRVSIPTVKNWRKEGKIVPTLKIPGGSVRYTLADLQNFEQQTGRKEAEQA